MQNKPESQRNSPTKSKLLENRTYVFDEFEYTPHKQHLTYRGTDCLLEPKMLQLIAILIEHRPKVVSKEVLMERLWPDSIVSDWSLARLVSDTRKLIEDDGQQQSIIKTVRGKGFALAVEVHEIIQAYPQDDDNHQDASIDNTTSQRKKVPQAHLPSKLNQFKPVWIVLGIVLIGIILYSLRDATTVTATEDHQAANHYLQVMYEIQKNLRLTKSTYLAQKRRRNELKDLLVTKLPEETSLSSEKRMRLHYPNLTTEEKFIFDQIRAMTEGPMYQGNFAILDLLDKHPEIYREIDTFHALYNHLNIWVNKYQKIFLNQPDMCFVFVGEEDGVPFPSQIDGLVDDWIVSNSKIKTN